MATAKAEFDNLAFARYSAVRTPIARRRAILVHKVSQIGVVDPSWLMIMGP
jgi:hypothetical protein